MSSNNETQPSTLGGIINSAAGAIQSGIGQLTGSGADYSHGEAKRNLGEQQKDESRATAKVGPFTATSEGGAHVDNKDRTEGSWDQTIGSGKQFVGGVIGSDNLKSQGRDQYDAGVSKEAQGQANDFVQGVGDRVQGTLGGIGAALTNDRVAQEKYAEQHDQGKASQRSVEYDLQKRAEAEQRKDTSNY